MNPNWPGILSAFLALAAFFAVFRAAEALPRKNRFFFTAFAMVAALPAASFALHYAHLFPETSAYYQFRSLPGTEFLIVTLGIAGGLAATLLPRTLRWIALLGVTAFSFVPFLKPFLGPIPEDAWQNSWTEGVCLQSTPSTCGAASLATILHHLGVEATESQIAAEAHSYARGTEAWYLARVARSRGLEARFDLTSGFAPEDGLPAVVGVRLGTFGHFIAVLESRETGYLIGDPLQGRELLSLDELQSRYDFTGFHLRIKGEPQVSPPPAG